MNPWVSIIAQYGLEFAIELAKIIEDKTDPTSADFQALKAKYGTKTADQFLDEAGGPPVPVVVVAPIPTTPA